VVPELKRRLAAGSSGSPGAVLMCRTYSLTFVPADQVKVTVEPDSVLPEAGARSEPETAALLAPNTACGKQVISARSRHVRRHMPNRSIRNCPAQ
jgi:hypothetical protein